MLFALLYVFAALFMYTTARPRYGLWSLSLPRRPGFIHMLQLDAVEPPQVISTTTTELPTAQTFTSTPSSPVDDLLRGLGQKLDQLMLTLRFHEDLKQLVESSGRALLNAIVRDASAACNLQAVQTRATLRPDVLQQRLHRAAVETMERLEPVLKSAGILGIANHMQTELVSRAMSVLRARCTKSSSRRLHLREQQTTSKYQENAFSSVKVLDIPTSESFLENVLKVVADGSSRRQKLSNTVLGLIRRSVDDSIHSIVNAAEDRCRRGQLTDQGIAWIGGALDRITHNAIETACPEEVTETRMCRQGISQILDSVTRTADRYNECRYVRERVVGMQSAADNFDKTIDLVRGRKFPDYDMRFPNDTQFVSHLLHVLDDAAVRTIPVVDDDAVTTTGMYNFAGMLAETMVKTVLSTCVRIIRRNEVDGFPTLSQALEGTATSLTELVVPTLVRIGVSESTGLLGDAFVDALLKTVGTGCELVPHSIRVPLRDIIGQHVG